MKLKILSLTLLTVLSTSFMANADTDSKDLSITLNNNSWIKVSQPSPIAFEVTAGSELTDLNASTSFCVTANSDYTLEIADDLSASLGYSTFNLFTKSFTVEESENQSLLKKSVPVKIRLAHNKIVAGVSTPEFIAVGTGNSGDYSNSFDNGYSTNPDLDINSFANNCVSKTTGETLKNYTLDVQIQSYDLEKLRAGNFSNKLTIKATNNTEFANCSLFPDEPECQV